MCVCVLKRSSEEKREDQRKGVSYFVLPYFQHVGLFMWTVCASVIFLLALFCLLHLMFFTLHEEGLKYTLFQDIFATLE